MANDRGRCDVCAAKKRGGAAYTDVGAGLDVLLKALLAAEGREAGVVGH